MLVGLRETRPDGGVGSLLQEVVEIGLAVDDTMKLLSDLPLADLLLLLYRSLPVLVLLVHSLHPVTKRGRPIHFRLERATLGEGALGTERELELRSSAVEPARGG